VLGAIAYATRTSRRVQSTMEPVLVMEAGE
jgi:hypothetical protein